MLRGQHEVVAIRCGELPHGWVPCWLLVGKGPKHDGLLGLGNRPSLRCSVLCRLLQKRVRLHALYLCLWCHHLKWDKHYGGQQW
jgi:hypothetical protein